MIPTNSLPEKGLFGAGAREEIHVHQLPNCIPRGWAKYAEHPTAANVQSLKQGIGHGAAMNRLIGRGIKIRRDQLSRFQLCQSISVRIAGIFVIQKKQQAVEGVIVANDWLSGQAVPEVEFC